MPQYYLAFDVGIKNLSYCIGSFDEQNNLTIIHWGLLDNSLKLPICNNINKNRTCSHNADYKLENNTFLCKKHYNNEKAKLLKSIEEYKDNFDKQMERVYIGLDNFYNNIISKSFDVNKNFENIQIIIENQPVLTNPIMKTISTAIYLFFLHKKIHHPQLISSVKFLSATVKTSDMFINFLKLDKQITSTFDVKDYGSRKKFTVDITTKYLLTLDKNLYNISADAKFNLETKKDDMADSFLYIVYNHYKNYITSNKKKFMKK